MASIPVFPRRDTPPVRIADPAGSAVTGPPADLSAHSDEGLRSLRAQLLLRHFTGPDAAPLVVTSPRHGDGRSHLLLALAGALAEAGRSVAVVDADLHRPVLRTRTGVGVGAGAGLERVLTGEVRWEAALLPLPACPGVSLLAAESAPARASALLARPALAQLFAALCAHHDAVLVDSPPWRESGDAHWLAARAGAALLLAPRHRTTLTEVHAVADGVRAAGAVLVGSVLGARPAGRWKWPALRRKR